MLQSFYLLTFSHKIWPEQDLTVFQEKILCYDGVLLKRILSSFQSFNLYSKIVSNQKDESLFVTHWTTQHTTNQAFLKSHLKFLYLLAKIVSHIIKLSFWNFFVKIIEQCDEMGFKQTKCKNRCDVWSHHYQILTPIWVDA